MNQPDTRPRNFVPMVAGFEAGLAVVAILLGWLLGVWPLATLAWDPRAIGWGLLATAPLLAGLWLAVRFPIGPFRGMVEVVDHMLAELMSGATLGHFALISLTAGIGEETLFRGLVQALAENWSGSWLTGLLVAGVLFGLAHNVTATYGVVASVVGVYFGLLWLHTENLLAPIAAHAAYDFFAIWYLKATAHRRQSAERFADPPRNDDPPPPYMNDASTSDGAGP